MKLKTTRVDSEIKTDSTGDVAFLLVVFFVVTAAFAATKGLQFDLPTDDVVDGDDGRESIMIAIDEQGGLDVDCRSMVPSEVAGYLQARLSRNPNKPVVIRAHDDAPYGSMVGVLDILAAGPRHGFEATNVQITTPQIVQEYMQAFGEDPFAAHCARTGP